MVEITGRFFKVLPIFGLSFILLNACGRYVKPWYPEDKSPSAVKELEASPASESVKLKWEAPDTDQNGDSLKSIDGYIVKRADINSQASECDDFKEIGRVSDKHLLMKDKLREERIKEGRSARNIRLSDEYSIFELEDTKVSGGSVYCYQVVPYNNWETEGEVSQIVKIIFKGTASHLYFIPFSER